MEKSHVGLEMRRCRVCGSDFDTGNLLLDRRLKNTLEHKQLTGWGECPKCAELLKERVALIEIDPTKSKITNGQIQQEDAFRTGRSAWIRREAASRIFSVEISTMAFLDNEAFEKVLSMMPHQSGESDVRSEEPASGAAHA